ncbi:hypothetical protein [Clostridium sp.]|uniref:hypothetical protein n=1 Tax=Clostridium sp. TaxID=1506 RepID=UPI002FC8D70A
MLTISLLLVIEAAMFVGAAIGISKKIKELNLKVDDVILMQKATINKVEHLKNNMMDNLWDIKAHMEKQDMNSGVNKVDVIEVIQDETNKLYFKLLFPPVRYTPKNK